MAHHGNLPGNDPDRADLTAAGDATVAANTGGLRVSNLLDFDLNPGTTVGGSPALVYNSDTASAQPIVEVTLQAPAGQALASVSAQLTSMAASLGRQASPPLP